MTVDTTDRTRCIGCLEVRLGRQLTPSDFTGFPINDPHPWDTPRLRSRRDTPLLREPSGHIHPLRVKS